MKNVLIYNSQAVGDCILGTHTARLYKQKFPNTNIYFCTRENLVPTTSEGEKENIDILHVLSLQEGITGVGQIVRTVNGMSVKLFGSKDPVEFNEIIEQHAWFSDLGIVRSQSSTLFSQYGKDDFWGTETAFNVGSDKNLPSDHIVISTVGPLDWNRKTKNEAMRIGFLSKLKYYLEQNGIKARIALLGRDVEYGSLLDSLRKLNNSHIFIGPMGLHSHVAAGLGLDTITIPSVFPAEYDSPEHYHSGWHKTLKSSIHCGNYACVKPKTYSEDNKYPEGPHASMGFWPKMCDETSNGFSCVHNISPDAIMELFADWYEQKGKNLWNR